MIIDLHTHSTVSDGTQSPAELMAEAAACGVDVIGLTDHDTTGGWAEATEAVTRLGIGLVPGMEISCRYEGISVHLLSYLHDPASTELAATVGAARSDREGRAREIVARLAEDFPLSWADIEAVWEPGATIGRPHIADALVRAGIVTDRTAAFSELLSTRSKYYVTLPTVSPIDAIRMVREAGGVSVYAHPRARMRGRVVPDAGMREMIAAGLDGIEVDHRDNPVAERAELRRIAASHDLIVTGSSDYHGAGKPNLLAENTTAPEMLARIVRAASGASPVGLSL
ncbi:PHP domain-containing protein [Brevibacterium luteolum]|uniref:PHP domain-containing protein n=1 Tax=Brevibacterium luteolum TaxID=199591 RepID=UPI00223BDD61|nr:PHP domain-containing protein [Brevibacterium luteolum]MCT1922017.1 PHP domain-containing protein [Brevibacterium luteolum]